MIFVNMICLFVVISWSYWLTCNDVGVMPLFTTLGKRKTKESVVSTCPHGLNLIFVSHRREIFYVVDFFEYAIILESELYVVLHVVDMNWHLFNVFLINKLVVDVKIDNIPPPWNEMNFFVNRFIEDSQSKRPSDNQLNWF